jgi:hypothetical protein
LDAARLKTFEILNLTKLLILIDNLLKLFTGTFVNSVLANLALDPNVELFVVSGRPENVPQSFPFEEKWLKLDNNTREGIYKRVIGRTICVPVEKWQRLDK